MPEIIMTGKHKAGLHAHPASIFVQSAVKYSSDSEVIHGDTIANAKSILAVLSLGAHKGSDLLIKAEGKIPMRR